MRRTEECRIHGTPSRAANRTLLFMVLASLSVMVWHVWVYGPSTEPISPQLVQRPFPVLLGSEMWDVLFGRHGMIAELWDVFPYFLVGILLAGYIRTYKIAAKLQMTLRRYGFLSVFLASLIGLITPLCACGTLTTAISLLFAGLPLAPVMALLVTSPLLSPSTYLLTLNDLGPEWTVIRTIAAFSMGMFAGVVTHLLRDRGFQSEDIFIEGAIVRGDFHDESYPDERLRCNCREKFGNRVAARTKNMVLVFLAKSSEMLWLVGKYVLVGVAIGTIVERYMPKEWLFRLFGEKNPLSIVWVTLGSVPVFLHQISASSILYHIKSSLNGTLDGGAGLAFMIGGPVTAIPTMILFWTIFKKRVFFLYLSVCIVGTIMIAYAFQFLVFVPHVDTGNPLLRNVSVISGGSSSVITKQNKHVRMVMDPGGKGIIATYTNDLEGGGIVFDAGFDRFLTGSADRHDDRVYVGNIAGWLEENSSSGTEKNILVYNTFRESGLGNNAFAGILADLEKKGFRVTVRDRRGMPELSGSLIEEYGQLWMFFGESGPGPSFTDPELEAISSFNRSGRGMLIVAGQHPGGRFDVGSANQVASRFGVVFSGFTETNNVLTVSAASHLLNRTAGALGKILKIVHKA